MRSSLLALVLVVAPLAAQQSGPVRPAIGESVTTASGLIYRFTQIGNGPKPADGDLTAIAPGPTFRRTPRWSSTTRSSA